MASASADRFRDVITQALGLEENPGDDELVARLLAAHGLAGQPERTQWRDTLTSAETRLQEAGFTLAWQQADRRAWLRRGWRRGGRARAGG